MTKKARLIIYIKPGMLVLRMLQALRVPKAISKFIALLFVFYRFDGRIYWYRFRPESHRNEKPI